MKKILRLWVKVMFELVMLLNDTEMLHPFPGKYAKMLVANE